MPFYEILRPIWAPDRFQRIRIRNTRVGPARKIRPPSPAPKAYRLPPPVDPLRPNLRNGTAGPLTAEAQLALFQVCGGAHRIWIRRFPTVRSLRSKSASSTPPMAREQLNICHSA